MASAKVREAVGVASVLKRQEYLLDTARNAATRSTATDLLAAIHEESHQEAFSDLAAKLVDTIQSLFPTTKLSYGGVTTDAKEKVLVRFHTIRLGELERLWRELFCMLGGQISPNPMVEQYTNQQLFDNLCVSHFAKSGTGKGLLRVPTVPLTVDEENIMRYYVPFKLLQRFEKQGSMKAVQYVECLSEMSVRGGGDFPTYATIW